VRNRDAHAIDVRDHNTKAKQEGNAPAAMVRSRRQWIACC